MLSIIPHPTQQVSHTLHCGSARTALITVVADPIHSNMWRVRLPDGRVSDMVNLSRAKDAATRVAMQANPELRDATRLHWKKHAGESPPGAPGRVFRRDPYAPYLPANFVTPNRHELRPALKDYVIVTAYQTRPCALSEFAH